MELQRNPPPSTDPNTRVFTIRGTAQQMDLARQLIDDKIGVHEPPAAQHQVQRKYFTDNVSALKTVCWFTPNSTQKSGNLRD